MIGRAELDLGKKFTEAKGIKMVLRVFVRKKTTLIKSNIFITILL